MRKKKEEEEIVWKIIEKISGGKELVERGGIGSDGRATIGGRRGGRRGAPIAIDIGENNGGSKVKEEDIYGK